jgi:hypothetical protein
MKGGGAVRLAIHSVQNLTLIPLIVFFKLMKARRAVFEFLIVVKNSRMLSVLFFSLSFFAMAPSLIETN